MLLISYLGFMTVCSLSFLPQHGLGLVTSSFLVQEIARGGVLSRQHRACPDDGGYLKPTTEHHELRDISTTCRNKSFNYTLKKRLYHQLLAATHFLGTWPLAAEATTLQFLGKKPH